MPKFTFPLPGRSRKQPAAAAPMEPMSKAQRVLGSGHLDIDLPKSWDECSSSGVSLSAAGSSDPTTGSSIQTRDSRHKPQREWGDESEVIPYRLRTGEPNDIADEVYSEYTGILREQPSTSTIRSWYDKTKQPLAISQQTSASAMAKGLPAKAQRILDMDNLYEPPQVKGRRRPANLDLSLVGPGNTSNGNDREGPVLGNYVVRSPSLLSPLTPSGAKRPRRKIKKHPTHESLRPEKQDIHRPSTSETPQSQRISLQQHPPQPRQRDQGAPSHLNELSSLYKHYEQMSFAQVMEDDDVTEETFRTEQDPAQLAQKLPGAKIERRSYQPHTMPLPPAQQREEGLAGPLSSHPPLAMQSNLDSPSTQRSQSSQRSEGSHLGLHTQFVQAPLPVKNEQHSPLGYTASVSSRHTRTSKASRRTDKSFQASELNEKSVLMLSSDSEEDEDEAGSSGAGSAKGVIPTTSANPGRSNPETARSGLPDNADDTLEPRGRDSTQTFKRMSSAPAGFFTVPTRLSSKSTSPAPSTINSLGTMQRVPSSATAGSSSDLSLPITTSSTGTNNTRLRDSHYGIQEARAVTMVTARGPAPAQTQTRANESDQDTTDSDWGYDEYDDEPQPLRGETSASTGEHSLAAGPTPPMSPSSMEFYMQSPQALDEKDELFMGLTRQEQMLIQALRQRREQMRNNSSSGSSDGSSQHRLSKRGHQSNASEATITEKSFNFGFPAPPARRESVKASGTFGTLTGRSSTDFGMAGKEKERRASNAPVSPTRDGTVFVLSPPPSSHHKHSSSSLRDVASRQSLVSQGGERQGRSRLSHAGPSTSPMSMGENSSHSTSRGSYMRQSMTGSRESLTMPRSRRSTRRQPSELPANDGKASKGRPAPSSQHHYHRHEHWSIAEDEVTTAPPSRQPGEVDDGPGIPRPDSPISPLTGAFPAVPAKKQTLNNPSVRLSAFGPPRPTGGEFGWWGDDD